MKLIELAEEHNLDQELLQEVCIEDLSIALGSGMDSDLSDEEVRRILACDGLETVDGEEFQPIIDDEFIAKHKRVQAAKKAAETRKRREAEAVAEKKAKEQAKIDEELRKHEAALAERQKEEEAQRLVQEAERQREEEAEAIRVAAEEEARRQAEEDAARRMEANIEISRRLADLKREEEALAAEVAAADSASDGTTADDEDDSAAAVTDVTKPTSEVDKQAVARNIAKNLAQRPARKGRNATTEEAASTTEPASASAEPETTAPATDVSPVDSSDAAATAKTAAEATTSKAESGSKKPKIGSKLASLAKATAAKSDHRLKETQVKVDTKAAASVPEQKELSAEERRKVIQDNIRRNLAMQKRVQDAKTAERGRRGFTTINRRGSGGGAGGAGGGRGGGPNMGGPGGNNGPGGPGRPGGGRGRDRRDHRADRDEQDGSMRGGRRRKALSTEEEDLSGKTSFEVTLPCTVRDFSEASGLKVPVIVAKLLMAGTVANINSTLDKDLIELLAQEFSKEVTIKEAEDVQDQIEALHDEDDNEDDLAPRPPVVTILGHVDHGKTSLLDYIRSTQVTADEAGGITQHIGAYTVETASGMQVTFIDTPGHEAFTAMRARGAKVTDIAVIVVAADDGLMPQTIEAINHAKAADVSVVVAVNKIDKENADMDKCLRQLAENGLQAEEWGGDIAVIPVSALTGQGVEDLLERLALESEVLELQANYFAKASGTVLEANLSEGRGVTATLLVQRGTLCVGDIILAGSGYGKVRNLVDWKSGTVDNAGPSIAVEVMGLSELPRVGGRFHVVDNLKMAAQAANERAHELREKELAARNTTTSLATLFADIEEAKKKEIRLVIKADAAGSLEVLRTTLDDLSTADIKINLIHSGVGAINGSDVTLADASDAVVIGFNVVASGEARKAADNRGVQISSYTIIYELIDNIKRAMEGLLDPDEVEQVIGQAEVLATFRSSKSGIIAGLQVREGKVVRGCFLRITRDGVILHEGRTNTLRRFKEDVKEVKEGFECGLTIEKWQDIEVGDIFEFYQKKEVARTL